MKRRKLFSGIAGALASLIAGPTEAAADVPKPVLQVKTYTVSNAIAFAALYLPLPANSLIFWRGSLLLAGVQYLVVDNASFVLAPLPLSVGDTITVVTVSVG